MLKAHQQSNKPLTDKLERTKTQRKTSLNTFTSTKHDKTILVESIKTKTQSFNKQKLNNESNNDKNLITNNKIINKNENISLIKDTNEANNKCNNKRVNNINSINNKDINNNLLEKNNALLSSPQKQQQSIITTKTADKFNFSTIKQQKNKNKQPILNEIELTLTLKNEQSLF